jgi:hypothetical protein
MHPGLRQVRLPRLIEVAQNPVSGKQVPQDEAEKEKAETKHGVSQALV